MGVHDNTDSKYHLIGTSSFSKLTPKRPTTVTFNNDGPSNKRQKTNEIDNQKKNESFDKNSLSIQQQRKSLPVYRLRKRYL